MLHNLLEYEFKPLNRSSLSTRTILNFIQFQPKPDNDLNEQHLEG